MKIYKMGEKRRWVSLNTEFTGLCFLSDKQSQESLFLHPRDFWNLLGPMELFLKRRAQFLKPDVL